MLRLWNFTEMFPLNIELLSNVTLLCECQNLGCGGGKNLKIIFVLLENTAIFCSWSEWGQVEGPYFCWNKISRNCHLLYYFLFVSWGSNCWIGLKFTNNLNQHKITYAVNYFWANKFCSVCFVPLFPPSKHNFITFSLPIINSDFLRVCVLAKHG